MIEPIEPQEYVNLPGQKTTTVQEKQLEPTDKQSKDEIGEGWVRNRTRIEDGQVIIEQYDESGRLLKITPPGYLPYGEVA
jgi:hypothetical protein